MIEQNGRDLALLRAQVAEGQAEIARLREALTEIVRICDADGLALINRTPDDVGCVERRAGGVSRGRWIC